MSNSKITSYEELTIRIAQLNQQKEAQEIELKNNLKTVYESFQLKNIIKNTVKDLATDKDFRDDSFKAAGTMATDFIVGKVFNKNNSIKGFISTLLVEKLAVPLIKNNKDKIISFITNLMSREKHKDE